MTCHRLWKDSPIHTQHDPSVEVDWSSIAHSRSHWQQHPIQRSRCFWVHHISMNYSISQLHNCMCVISLAIYTRFRETGKQIVYIPYAHGFWIFLSPTFSTIPPTSSAKKSATFASVRPPATMTFSNERLSYCQKKHQNGKQKNKHAFLDPNCRIT